MSKIKKTIFILIMSIFILLIKNNTCQAMAQEVLGLKENAVGKTVYTGGSEMYNSWGYFGNVYCARQDLELHNGQNYYADVVYYLEIKGNEANYCSKGNSTLRPTSDSGDYRYGQLANILAKQVTTNGGYRTNAGCTDTQYALWYFLGTENSWVASRFGGTWAISSSYFTHARWQTTVKLGKANSNACANLAKSGTGYKGTVRIYWIAGKNQTVNQSLMLVELEEEEEEPETIIIDKTRTSDNAYMGGVGFTIKNDESGMYIKKADTVQETSSDESGRLVYEVGDMDTSNTEYWTSNESEAMVFTTGTEEEYKGLEIRGLPGGTYTVTEVSNPHEEYQSNIGKTFSLHTTTADEIDYASIIENEKDDDDDKSSGNLTISGMVWEDLFPKAKYSENNSKKDSTEVGVEGVEVYWKAEDGTVIDSTVTNAEGKYSMSSNIDYHFCEWEIDQEMYDKINNSYIEFKYNGLTYTSVAYSDDGAEDTSRAMENTTARSSLDDSFAEISKQGVSPEGSQLGYTYSSDTPRTATLSSPVGITDFAVTADTSIPLGSIGLLEDYAGTDKESETGCIKHHYETTETGTYHVCDEEGSKEVKWDIKNMNLGLVKREQPDMAIVSDIATVDVIMKEQRYTYTYGNRGITGENFNYQVSFSDKYTTLYKRPVNPSDIAYINDPNNNSDDLQVYVTYNIKVQNQSTTLIMEAQEIVNYYDTKYELIDSEGNWSETSQNGDSYEQNGIKAIYTQQLRGKKIPPQSSSEKIELKFQVKNEVVKELIAKDALFKNISEITMYSTYYGSETMCAEHETAGQKGRTEKQSAGVDRDSEPGNVEINIDNNEINTATFEDDTDVAPTFYLLKDEDGEPPEEKYKKMSGTVWEDSDANGTDNERLGDGIYNSENTVANVRVELLRVYDDNHVETAQLYTIDDNNDWVATPAVTYTNEDGYYEFEGIVVDNYIVRYTYGNDTEAKVTVTVRTKTEIEKREELALKNGAVTIDRNTQINARNYKSTIITQEPVRSTMQANNFNDEDNSLKWHLTSPTPENTSIAVDDIDNLTWNYKGTSINVNTDEDNVNGSMMDKDARLQIDSLMYGNFDDGLSNGVFDNGVNVSAYSLPFKVQVEYTENQYYDVTETGNRAKVTENGEKEEEGEFDHNWGVFDFGIIERAREDIVVDKTIDKLKITLANGQVLTEGSPYNETMNYVRALGEQDVFTRKKYEDSLIKEKEIYMEMDSELIQGATLEMLYKITVTNNSEIDYEYDPDFGGNEKYYYYGESYGLSPIKQSVEYLVDYVDPDLICEVGEGTQNVNWTKVNAETLLNDNISQDVWARVNKDSGNYLIFVTDQFENIEAKPRNVELDKLTADELARCQHSETLYVSKLLANQADEHVYENHAEIIQLNGRIARTIKKVGSNGEQIAKTYIPGNYIPSTKMLAMEETDLSRKHEQDDHSITVTITPPTGAENNMMIYVIAGTVALAVIGAGIYVIKRKIIK